MGVSSTSRKGKKAWRKNIDDAELVEVVQKETHQARRGPAVETLRDEELFFVDKVAPPPQQSAPARTGRAKKEKQLTRAQLILQAPQAIQPVMVHKHPMRKDTGPPAATQQQRALQKAPAPLAERRLHVAKPPDSTMSEPDLWGALPSDTAPSEPPTKFLSAVGPSSRAGVARHRAVPAPRIRAVEVDLPGCSYNPDFDSHQDALAVLVAAETKKMLRKELRPLAVPGLFLQGLVHDVDELTQLQTDIDVDDNEIPLDQGDEEEEGAEGPHASRGPKKTRKDRNKDLRVAAEARAAVGRLNLKRQRAQLADLNQLVETVEEEEADRSSRRQRRAVVADEKAASQPPKLGKLRFQDLSVQVLASEEVGQGLRRLKAYPMLAAERFKSLQKRGLVEPRRPVGQRMHSKTRIKFEKNARTEKAVAAQEELDDLKKANKLKLKAAKKLK
eukprot:CAMPEP_0119103352 /NCGR_PEP_ID=MMETSP1180-20130426/1797_1 /TAXON_ID=3052 ORGANISM="Chlamydomonas cf sp, Strain CCMP681" /NCGR_SAMPLE_ID=MMETSP1180 /ASSEMBLY_ACC=CAM_ASM_000741 /LENGTH=444 /DNA_ID=CAMNT_0007087823 /DNA_START=62 /DNA_END=1396 /DNA_ORIENTATION=-